MRLKFVGFGLDFGVYFEGDGKLLERFEYRCLIWCDLYFRWRIDRIFYNREGFGGLVMWLL